MPARGREERRGQRVRRRPERPGRPTSHDPARTAAVKRFARGGDPVRAEHRQNGDGDDRVDGDRAGQGELDGARDGAGGVADLLAQRRDAGVAGEREEEQAGRLEDVVRAVAVADQRPEPARVGIPAAEAGDDRDGESGQDQDDDDAGQPRGPGHPAVVDRDEREDGGDGDRTLPRRWRDVGGEGEGHGRAAGRLADHEPPAGQEPPPLAEPLAAVDVGPAGRSGTARPAGPTRWRCSRRRPRRWRGRSAGRRRPPRPRARTLRTLLRRSSTPGR